MRTPRRNVPEAAVLTSTTPKMKVVEILEGKRELLRVKDLVPLLNLSKSKVYEIIARGDLPSRRIDGAIRVDPNHLIAWCNQMANG